MRVSTGKQDLENQLKPLKMYCKGKGYDIVKVYEDVASGKSTKRQGFKQMFDDASKAKFDVIVFWSLDRFSRRGTLDTLKKIRLLEDYGVDWHSYQEPYFSSLGQFKDVVISIMATLAKAERKKISERTKAGLERAKARGVKLGRPKGAKDKKQRSRKGYFK